MDDFKDPRKNASVSKDFGSLKPVIYKLFNVQRES